MFGAYVTLFVKAPEGSGYATPAGMKSVDDQLIRIAPAMFKCPPPTGMPVQEQDGTWEVRVLEPSAVPMVKRFLTESYRFEIVSEKLEGGEEKASDE